MTRSRPTLDRAFESELQNLATTLRPGSVADYRSILKAFLNYLHATFPEIQQLSQLRRTPHIVGWLRSLHQRQPPLANPTRASHVISVRRVLNDLALYARRPPKEPLFVRGDVPPHDFCLPKPLSPEDDILLQEQLQKIDDLRANGLLLLRATGLRIGECLALSTDSLRHLGGPDWALHVPLGKLHNERWVPVDAHGRNLFARILQLRVPEAGFLESSGSLLRQKNQRPPSYTAMRYTLHQAAQCAGCSGHVTPHRLRHTYATSLLRAGVSILAIKELLGHHALGMTMRYVQVTQMDLQREYHEARQKMAFLYSTPKITGPQVGIAAIYQTIDHAKHLIEMYRRNLDDKEAQLRLHRIAGRLTKIAAKLTMLPDASK